MDFSQRRVTLRSLSPLFFALFLSWWAPASAAEFNYESFLKVLRENPKTQKPIRNTRELLEVLPDSLKKNFTLVYESRSPFAKEISPLFPRIILFSDDTRFVLTFTGDPSKTGYDVLETLRFVDSESRFELARFVLPEAASRSASLKRLASQNGKPNPQECLQCHGQDPRPINDSYPVWPGFYGSIQDTFIPDSKELKNYREFLKRQKDSPKLAYHQLIWGEGTSTPPYLDPSHYDPTRILGSLDLFGFLPNTRFGMGLTELNRKRIQRKLQASPRYSELKYGVLASLLECNGPPSVSPEAHKKIREDLRQESDQRLLRLGFKPGASDVKNHEMRELVFSKNLVEIDRMSQDFGVSRSDWSMALEENSMAFFDGILSSMRGDVSYYLKEDFIHEILAEISSSDPSFKRAYNPMWVYQLLGYPFGNRIYMDEAFLACAPLKARLAHASK